MNSNIDYWKNRYNSMDFMNVVGRIDWNSEKYQSENKKWEAIIEKYLKLQPIHNLLDFGCGIGRWKNLLKKYCKHYHGCDIVDLSKHFDNNEFEIIKSGVIPFPDKKFDFIFTCVVLQHVINDTLLLSYLLQFKDRLIKDSGDLGRLFILENITNSDSNNYLKFRTESVYTTTLNNAGFEMIKNEIIITDGEPHLVAIFNIKKGG